MGNLEYRSVRFENEVLDIPNFQGNAAVNYTDAETPWTRIIFGGRLGQYKYYDMDQVIRAAMDAVKKL